MKAVDIFAGAGGFSQGLVQAGVDVIGAFDNEPKALRMHAHNIPGRRSMLRGVGPVEAARRRSRHRHADLMDLLAVIPDIADLRPDLIVGGPPCQPFSNSGKRKGDDDPRAVLTEAFGVVVSAVRPTYFAMENVENAKKARVYERCLRMLRHAGYGVSEVVVDMSHFGIGQRRERLIVMGALGEADGWADAYLAAERSERPMTVRDVLGDGIGPVYFRIGHRGGKRKKKGEGRRSFWSTNAPAVATTTTADRKMDGPDGYRIRAADEAFFEREEIFFVYPGGSTSCGTRSAAEPLSTITRRAWDGPGKSYKLREGDIVDVHSLPCLSLEQLSALSGFPREWQWQPDEGRPLSKADRMLGLANAVPPAFAERLGRIFRHHRAGNPPRATVPLEFPEGFMETFKEWLVRRGGVRAENAEQRASEARAALRILNGRRIPSLREAERILEGLREFTELGRSRRSNLTTSLRLYYRHLGYLRSLGPVDVEAHDIEDEPTPIPVGFSLRRVSAPALDLQDEDSEVVLLDAAPEAVPAALGAGDPVRETEKDEGGSPRRLPVGELGVPA